MLIPLNRFMLRKKIRGYYKNGGSKIKHLSGSTVGWWLRSVRYTNGINFCLVGKAGGAGSSYASISNGAAPCFCV